MLVDPAISKMYSPIFERLIAMVGAARNAFNRHSRSSMEELQSHHQSANREIEAALKWITSQMALEPKAHSTFLVRCQGIFHHLQGMAAILGGLADPIQKKIKDSVLFSDKAVSQTNYLFDHQGGLLRSILDVIKTDNDFLKKYTLEEGQALLQACRDFATEHEERLIEGVCLPQAAPIFLAILDAVRNISQHEVDIALELAKKP